MGSRGGEPGVDGADELRIALREVDVGDPPAPRQQVEGKLPWIEVGIARHVLEIARALQRSLLEALDDGLALHLVVVEGRAQVSMPSQGIDEGNAVFHRQLGPRADRKVGGVGGVAEQDDLAVVPALLAQGQEVDPERAVRHQPPSSQLRLEEVFAVGDAVRLARRIQACVTPGSLRTLDDEGAGARVERISVNLEEAVIIAAKDEGEGVERQVAPKPDVLRRMCQDLRLEELAIRAANQAVDAIRPHDEIGALELPHVADLALEFQPDAERPAAPLEDVEQDLAGDAGKDVAPGPDHGVAVMDVDRVPASETLADLGIGFVVGIPKGTERLLGEDDAPTEGGVGWVALNQENLVTRVGFLGQQRKVQSRRPAADDGVAHRFSRSPRPADQPAPHRKS